mmetsp:Transcript_20171/g.22537  ORF Transcript_20171/g.22537 Transcript_20171/m.22537 type:complete len:84 (-) Transcript_20171:158-409(-)
MTFSNSASRIKLYSSGLLGKTGMVLLSTDPPPRKLTTLMVEGRARNKGERAAALEDDGRLGVVLGELCMPKARTSVRESHKSK